MVSSTILAVFSWNILSYDCGKLVKTNGYAEFYRNSVNIVFVGDQNIQRLRYVNEKSYGDTLEGKNPIQRFKATEYPSGEPTFVVNYKNQNKLILFNARFGKCVITGEQNDQ